MITGEGGFVSRMMPPVDWDCGSIPQDCYDPQLTKREIENKLLAAYLTEDRVKKLANSDDEIEISRARLSLQIIAEIDADTIWSMRCNVGKFDYIIEQTKKMTPAETKASLIQCGIIDQDGELMLKYQTTPQERLDADCMTLGDEVHGNLNEEGEIKDRIIKAVGHIRNFCIENNIHPDSVGLQYD